MAERKNTVVCTFEATSPKTSAVDIHEWCFNDLKVTEDILLAIQIDGVKKQVFIKFTEQRHVDNILQMTNGQIEFKHGNGEISIVTIDTAGLGTRRVRIANLPPELNNTSIRTSLTPFGQIHSITDENWSSRYRFQVTNGIRIIHMTLTRHLPSNLHIAGYRAFVSYEGQPPTCFECGATEHIFQSCPKRKNSIIRNRDKTTSAWSYSIQQRDNNAPQTIPPNRLEQLERTTISLVTINNSETGRELINNSTTSQSNKTETVHSIHPNVPMTQGQEHKEEQIRKQTWAEETEELDKSFTEEGVGGPCLQICEQQWPTPAETLIPVRIKKEVRTSNDMDITTIVTNINPTVNTDSNITKGKKQRLEKSAERIPEPKRTKNKYKQ